MAHVHGHLIQKLLERKQASTAGEFDKIIGLLKALAKGVEGCQAKCDIMHVILDLEEAKMTWQGQS